jgi:hypothetical protein
MTEFDDRIAAVEARLEGSDVPDSWSRLMRKLEQGWQPDAETLLAAGSITIDSLSSALTFGGGTVEWPGGSPLTTVLTVRHGLERQPTNVQLTATGSNINLWWSGATTTTFDVEGATIDGSSPAALTARGFSWEAK